VTIHQHGDAIPHGDEILEALTSAKLDEGHLQDLEEGCRISSLLFLRMIDWCLTGDEFVNSPFGVKPFQLKKCG
jgi:hypothetical protein